MNTMLRPAPFRTFKSRDACVAAIVRRQRRLNPTREESNPYPDTVLWPEHADADQLGIVWVMAFQPANSRTLYLRTDGSIS